ncbi:hypothetical protein D3C81_1715280 [compost metagenome]
MQLNAEHQSNTQHINQQGGSSIADKWQRNTCYRHQTNHHTNILKYLKQEHGHDAYNNIRASFVDAIHRDNNHPVYKQKV